MRQLILGTLGCLAMFGVAAWAQAPNATLAASAPRSVRPLRQAPPQNGQPLPGGQGGGNANLGPGGGAGGGSAIVPPPGLNADPGQFSAFPPTLTPSEGRPEKHVDTLIDFNRNAIDYRSSAVDHNQGAIDYSVRSDAGAPN